MKMGPQMLLFWLTILLLRIVTSEAASEAKPGCPDKCGNVSVPYPFGTGEDSRCFKDKKFKLVCNSTHYDPPQLFFRDIRILNVWVQQGLAIVNTPMSYNCYNESGNSTYNFIYNINLTGSPFTLSNINKLTATGCDTLAYIVDYGESDGYMYRYMSACASLCTYLDIGNVNEEYSCLGDGCCQTSIPKNLKTVETYLFSVDSLNIFRNSTRDLNSCSYAFLADPDWTFNISVNKDKSRYSQVVLDWVVGEETCEDARRNHQSYACGSNSNCYNSNNGPGYRCNCSSGYQGNPYLPDGCQGIESTEHCVDIGVGCIAAKMVILGVGLGIFVLIVCSSLLYLAIKHRRLIRYREKFFQQNGGLLLQQHIASRRGVSEIATIFTVEDLKKATNNYDDSRVLGEGGYGTVYKGILPDKRVVAIKKSKVVDKSQIAQFINEVDILSQINHRNVVKLLGCCLETEVPMLVYEFIPNGTLFQYIHSESHANSFSWENRLRIASETAGALAYLHSSHSIPILHRDVKSANILLDDNYTAKVSDFGASRLVPLDQTQMTTLVQGTLGYLDPECFHTGQITEKSDVYSFGVVLVELLTGEKPLSSERSEAHRSLTMYFTSSIKDNRLFQILDDRVVNEGDMEQLLAFAELTKRCLHMKGEERPTMKEVAAELDRLRKLGEQSLVEQNHEETEFLLGEPSNSSTGVATGQNSLGNAFIMPMEIAR